LEQEPRGVSESFARIIEVAVAMSESRNDVCGKCDAEIDPSKRVDFTLKDGTRVCESGFVKETRQTRSGGPN
jgi:hypothetical protein